MEEKLLEIFKLADELNKSQDKVYAEIQYTADDRKRLELSIRSKQDFSYVEKCEIQLTHNPLLKWDSLVDLFRNYVGGNIHE